MDWERERESERERERERERRLTNEQTWGPANYLKHLNKNPQRQ